MHSTALRSFHPRSCRPSAGCCGLLLAALLLLSSLTTPTEISAGGFEFRLPINRVNILSDRRSNVYFIGESILFRLQYQTAYPNAATRYSIRDFEGNLVESGPIVGPFIIPGATIPGWYKLYLHGTPVYVRQANDPVADPEWGDSVGGTMFVIFRPDARFPALPPVGTTPGTEGLSDNVMRGIVGSGPQRHRFSASSTWQTTNTSRAQDVAQEKTYYTPFDPYRNRQLLGVFPSGTSNPNGTASLANVQQVVQAFQNDIKVWEGRNEPNYANNGLSGSPSSFAITEFIPFADTVHGVNPTLKAIGPGNVQIKPGSHGLNFIQEFLATMSAQNALHKLDGISIHVYNSFNGDPFLARRSMNGLMNVLNQYGQQNKERWQTEQGFAAAINGSYQPRMQTRWTMLMLLILEQYGIPKEQNYLFYDKSGGYYPVPTWWINGDLTLNPLGALLRVWSEELYGTRHTAAYDFGVTGNKLYLGSLFTGPGKQVAAIMSSGSTDGQVRLQVSTPSVEVISPFGLQRTIPASSGEVLLPVTELPTYVRFTGTLAVVPQNWGPNLALGKPVTSTVMGRHPADASIVNPTSKVTNGEFENWYYLQTQETKVWVDGSTTFPAWVEINLQQPTTLDRVAIYSGVPWQWDGTLLDYDLQYDQGGNWVTVQSVLEPMRTFKSFTVTNRTTVDSFFSDRWVFTHSFLPVTTSKLRLWVRNVTYGGGVNQLVQQAGGQTGLRIINLREVEAYSSGTQDVPNVPPTAANDSGSGDRDGVEIRVLANDSDSDAWPQPLRIESVSSPANGAVAIVGDRIRYVPNGNFSGADAFTYSVTDGLKSATATVNVTTIPTPVRAGGLVNFKGDYFSDANFNTLAFTRYDPAVNFNWGTGSPHPSIPASGYSVRWTGQIKPPFTGMYELSTITSPRVRLWIDGNLLIDRWAGHAVFQHRTSVLMDSRRTYDFKMEYAAFGYTGTAQFLWSHPLQPQAAPIPLAPIETWRRSAFPTSQLADLVATSPGATPAGDGISNLMKYALRLSPLTPATGSEFLPQTSQFSDAGRTYLAVTYRKNSTATDVSYRVSVTDRLDAPTVWDSVAPPEEIMATDPVTGDPIVRRRVDVTGSPMKFIRLDVR